MKVYDIIIIGGGVTGFAGAMYAGRLNLKTLICGDLPGGVITTTDTVENYPGFIHLTGQELADKIKEHALSYPVEFLQERVRAVKKEKTCFTVTAAGKKYHSKTLLFATGTKYRTLNIPGEKEFKNKGVHECALCDGAFYKNKVVAVIGGSDSAAKDALVLTQYAQKVYIICRGEKIRPEPVNLKRVEANKKIEIIPSTNLLEIKGDAGEGTSKNVKKVAGIVLDRAYRGKKELALDGVFVAIGHIPLAELAQSIGVTVNKKGEIIIDRNAHTNVQGVYAAGDVGDTRFKQAITGVAEAVLAVYSAYEYVNTQEFVCPREDPVRAQKKNNTKNKK